jgi:hypothetical protein
MKLHSPNWKLLVPHAHDLAFLCFSGDLKAIRQRVRLDYKRMVARRLERIRHVFEQIFPIVADGRRFPVHHPVVHNHIRAEDVSDALMPQANTKNGRVRAKCADDLIR